MPAKSKNQQQFMGMVHGLQKGEIDPNDVSQDVLDAANSMTKKDAKDFASTKHKGLPTKVTKESMKNIDKVFEQIFNEGAFPDRTTQADSFTEPGEDILDFDKERNERIKKEVVRRLRQEAFPDNWLVGRKGNNHTATKTAPRTYDDDEANFIVRNSGQPDLEADLEEHHEDYPDNILQMSVGDFLTKSKEKDEELYHGIESIIDKFIGGVNESVINEANMLQKFDIANDNLRDVGSYLWDRKHKDAKKFHTLFSALEKLISRRELANMTESKLNESAMGTIDILAQDAPNFKKFLQDVFKEFKDLEKTKEAISWLKSIYDNKTNESVVNEEAQLFITDIDNLIPAGLFDTDKLKSDLTNALNAIYKKYKINRVVKNR